MNSKIQLQRELNFPWITDYARDLAERRIRGGRRVASRRIVEIRMIERVEKLRAEFHFPGFAHQELLEQTQIDIFEPRTVEPTRTAISKCAVCRNRKGRRIEIEPRRSAAEYARWI